MFRVMRGNSKVIDKKAFKQGEYLEQPNVAHAAVKQHQCDECTKTFTKLAYLKQHLRTHSGARNHQCNLCLKTFTLAGNLKRHLLIHTGVKEHKFVYAIKHSHGLDI